jgi:peptidoglycan/LPS O-acetylase OafA/YrhL
MMLMLQMVGWLVAISVSFVFFQLVEKPLNDWRHQITANK